MQGKHPNNCVKLDQKLIYFLYASAGTRARVATLGGLHHTPRPLTLRNNKILMYNIPQLLVGAPSLYQFSTKDCNTTTFVVSSKVLLCRTLHLFFSHFIDTILLDAAAPKTQLLFSGIWTVPRCLIVVNISLAMYVRCNKMFDVSSASRTQLS